MEERKPLLLLLLLLSCGVAAVGLDECGGGGGGGGGGGDVLGVMLAPPPMPPMPPPSSPLLLREKRSFTPYRRGAEVAKLISNTLDTVLLRSGYDKQVRPGVSDMKKKPAHGSPPKKIRRGAIQVCHLLNNRKAESAIRLEFDLSLY